MKIFISIIVMLVAVGCSNQDADIKKMLDVNRDLQDLCDHHKFLWKMEFESNQDLLEEIKEYQKVTKKVREMLNVIDEQNVMIKQSAENLAAAVKNAREWKDLYDKSAVTNEFLEFEIKKLEEDK